VGSKIAAKVSEFLTSGHLRKVDEICSTERSQVVELFTKVWGVGPTTAQSWFQQVRRKFITLMMEAVHTSEMSVYLTKLHDAIFQKAVIFRNKLVCRPSGLFHPH
jgi:DNA polymerase/3'-5' exonuclease PolX